ncbi:hypothetical protein UM399_11950 [Sulfitobacter pontiacus]|uniref:hypothetical protein n=1 Tax=Sulfitobacter pontiacus TaxID=60137 RepID=UPI002AC931B5|nr:hypothetical protein [Sulfitobacter pontiacus]WPZ24875.1 hypothetical protein UM399_11950 [Sulfitobacter pontiacus]|tara:strand:+ start:8281 stop:8976 length:696 start_codon:yes stop_codon:yes gene_type:complete
MGKAMYIGQKATVQKVAGTADQLGRVRQTISIQRLLEWAFADECASVDFEDAGTLAAGYGMIGNAGLMADYGALGCRVSGGGRSLPDPDADLVAAAVAVLPEGCGGRRMAVQIAELARARRVPDAMVGAQSRCIPVGTRQNMHGNWGLTESLGTAVDTSGRKVKRIDVRWCPVTYTLTADKIGRARRNYLQWWSALMEVRSTFKIYNNLSRWQVSDVMPERAPWKKVLPNK